MLYKVQASWHSDSLKDFFIKLTDGTIENQKPDGLEVLNSMKKAKIVSENRLEWYETCFCKTPLKHERETIYDNYFYDFTTTLVEREEDDSVGNSFWKYIEKL